MSSKKIKEIEYKTREICKLIINKLKKFCNKDNYTKTKLILVILFSIAFSTICEYTIFRKLHPEFISKNRIMLVSLIYSFIGIHFVFRLDKMYEWIHKNRYKIACAFLLFVTIFKYSGSSIVNFHSFTALQPHSDNSRFHTLLGKARTNRTDEWATSTTYILSQSRAYNAFQYFSNVLRGTETDMFTVANSPVYDILMLGRPLQIGFILFGNDYGLSLYWYSRLVLMLLGAYEICLILTKGNKKVSLCGMIVITFSAAVQWWYCMDTLLWGQLVIVLLNKFLKTDKKWVKYLCALGVLVSGLSYIFVFYPAWQLSFGYVFLAMVIWLLIDNIKYGKYKINLHDIIIVLITIICLVVLLARWYSLSKNTLQAEMNTDYPGSRNEIGGGAINLYSYFYDIFFAYEDFLDPCEYSAMLSFYPIPIILGLIYVIRNKKDLHFWIPMLIVGGFLTIWCVWGFPKWLAIITKMSMTTAGRVSIPLGTVCIYLLVYLLGNFDERDKLINNKKLAATLAGIATIYIVYKAKSTIGFANDFPYLDRFKILVASEIFLIAIFGILNMDNKKIRNCTLYCLITIALITGLRVNPVIRTTDIFYEKPVAKKFNEINIQNPDSIWIVNDGGWYLNDYAIASGIRTLNSTALYPNFDFFETILGEEAKNEEYRKIYNRYAHMRVQVVDDETEVELLYPDDISVKLNYEDLNNLNVNYIISTTDLNEELKEEQFKKIYDEDGMYIFEVMEGIKIDE